MSSLLSGNVSVVYSAFYAFAALKTDGSVVTWGESDYGGDSSSVSSQLTSQVTVVFGNNIPYSDSTHSHSFSDCASGYTRYSYASYLMFSSTCAVCNPGAYLVSGFYCGSCDGGSYQPESGQASCITCPANSYCVEGSVNATSCPTDEFSKQGSTILQKGWVC